MESTEEVTTKFGAYFTVVAKTPEHEDDAAVLQMILNEMEIADEFLDLVVAEYLKAQ